MPLLCLSELRDPRLFDEAMHMASQWGADVAHNYVSMLIKSRSLGGNSAFLDRKPKGYWQRHILDRLAKANGRSLVYRDFAEGLGRSERYGLKESLRVLCKRGVLIKVGSDRRNYKYSLKK